MEGKSLYVRRKCDCILKSSPSLFFTGLRKRHKHGNRQIMYSPAQHELVNVFSLVYAPCGGNKSCVPSVQSLEILQQRLINNTINAMFQFDGVDLHAPDGLHL